MDIEKIKKHPLFLPILIAVLLHLILISIAMVIRMPGLAEVARKVSRTFHIKDIDLKPRPSRTQGTVSAQESVNALRFTNDKKIANARPLKDVPLDALVPRTRPDANLAGDAPQKRPASIPSSVEKRSDLEELLIETEERQIQEKIQSKQKSSPGLLSELSEKVTQKSASSGEGYSSELQKIAKGLASYSPKSLDVDPDEGMPGFTPGATDSAESGPAGTEMVGEAQGEFTKYESLDDWMDIKVYTYQDKPTRENYYLIKIFAKKGKQPFKVLPKEILFTIDASLSISKDRLEEIKEGIRYCLTNLNPGDTFNIVAFKDKTAFFKPQSVPATPDTVKEAQRFVMSLTASERTDVYAAFQGIVERPVAGRPSNVILISDGRPTYGVVDSRELINGVTRINKKVRPVFSFSGGAKVNRYLLDFISYQNRAWSQFVKEIRDIDKGLAEFYDKIKDPLFLNLRYRLSGLEEGEVFPRSLPDFYRNAEFTLFGKYSDEDKFSMQLLGDVQGQTKELIFERSLQDAEKGGPEIMKGYAFNRIYYLINRVTEEGPRPELLNEIDALSRRYGITTPYSPELEKLD
jgi:hypothetical protein